MAKDYEVNAKVNDGTSSAPDDYSRAYKVIRTCRKKLSKTIESLQSSIPEEIDLCNVSSLFDGLNNITKQIGEITKELVSGINLNLIGNSNNSDTVEIPAGSQKYMAAGIVLKEYQLLQYECERNKLIVERIVAETTKKMLVSLLDGGSSNAIAPIQVPLNILSTFAAVAGKIINALSILLSFLDKMTILNVKSSGCCFFLTPKSLKKTDIKVNNTNKSLTNNIPEAINKLLTEAEQKMKEKVAAKRTSEIAKMKANGENSASTGDLDVGSMESLPRFSLDDIKTARKILLQTIVDADGLPRYEDLKITNVRFLVYLVTGFEPAANKSFGIPGFP